MNCTTARNRLLSEPDPSAVPDAVADHLASCAGCLAWHRLLVQVDRAVAAAPVPATSGRTKRRLVDLFRTGRAPGASGSGVIMVPALAVAASRTGFRDRVTRYWPAGLVAAAVLVGTIAWVTLGGKPADTPVAQLPPDPFLKKVVAAKVKIDTAETAVGRLDGWAEMAKGLHEQAAELARITPEEVDSLASLYERAVGDDALVGQARLLSDDERKAALDRFVEDLRTAEREANGLLTGGVATAAERPLKRIAEAAAASRAKLVLIQRGRA